MFRGPNIRWPWLAVCLAGAAVIVLFLHPVASTLTRAAWLAGWAVLWGGLLALTWRRRLVRVGLLLLPGGIAAPFFLPARPVAPQALRAELVERLQALEGVCYVWGGESARGIDCSGLPRKALRDALFSEGLRTGNGGALRQAASLWWRDTSAMALGEGHRGLTVPLNVSGKIVSLDTSLLLPGDLAVTSSGAHVLVYFGDGRWIQADPGSDLVVLLHGTRDRNEWFGVEVALHRWAVLRGVEFRLALRQVWQAVIDHAVRHDFTVPASLREIPALAADPWSLRHVKLVYTGKITRVTAASTTPLLRVPQSTPDGADIVVFLDGHVDLANVWPTASPLQLSEHAVSNQPPMLIMVEDVAPPPNPRFAEIAGTPHVEDLDWPTREMVETVGKTPDFGEEVLRNEEYGSRRPSFSGLTADELDACWRKITAEAPDAGGILYIAATPSALTIYTDVARTPQDRSNTIWQFVRLGNVWLLSGSRPLDWNNAPRHSKRIGVSMAEVRQMMERARATARGGLSTLSVEAEKADLSIVLGLGTLGASGGSFVFEKDGLDGMWKDVQCTLWIE